MSRLYPSSSIYPDLSQLVSVTIPMPSTRHDFLPCHPDPDFIPTVEIKMHPDLDLEPTGPDFCRDLIILEISCPYLIVTHLKLANIVFTGVNFMSLH